MKDREQNGAPTRSLTARQQALIAFIQDLDPAVRHTLEIECRGAEPWSITTVKEHVKLRLPGAFEP